MTAGRLRHAVGDRHRNRHAAGGAGTRGGAVLHHQRTWCRQRPWPQHDLRLRQAVGRASADRQRGRPRHDGAALPAAGTTGGGAVSRPPTSDNPCRKGNESILLVDDNAEMRTVARRHLVSLGYRVSEAGSGPAALEILQDGDSFDLLFTDVVMPDGMTGYQLAAAARQVRPGLKVLFTTGYLRSDPGSEAGGVDGRRHDPQAVPPAGTRRDGAGGAGSLRRLLLLRRRRVAACRRPRPAACAAPPRRRRRCRARPR